MPLIIPLFIPHGGCPRRCIFCNEYLTAGGAIPPLTPVYIQETVTTYLMRSRRRDAVEIAIYGGNFTGLAASEQERILRLLAPYFATHQVGGIRISTRPDDIDLPTLQLLARYGVKTVELGVQSLNDEVLDAAHRGHSAKDAMDAVSLLKSLGFKVGMHLMIGLPGDRQETFHATIKQTIVLHPHMVRLHPTLVLKGTRLAHYYYEGRYVPLSLDEAIKQAAYAVRRFRAAGIPVIRLGLQTTKELEEPGNVVAGPFHPAFGALVQSHLLYEEAVHLLQDHHHEGRQVLFQVPPRDESAFRGERNENLHRLLTQFRLGGSPSQEGSSSRSSIDSKR